jgi:Flp pilus assembly protein TadG
MSGSSSRRHRGQGLVEFAVVLPIFLVMLFGIVDFGRVIWATNSLTNAATEATRFAIVHGGSPSDTCPVGPRGPLANVPAATSSCPYPSDSKQSIYDLARNYAIAGGSSVTVTVCYAAPGTTCSGDTDTGTNARGNSVTVVITSTLSLVTPSLLGMGNYAISGRSTMLVNH